ncbi:hypothetical protein [Vreelandella alkaliphila]|uniref:hypothetical protein n=1 Tax=Vreelandella alkaliphila TaxID=272774 RepID=UPI003FD77BB4
MEPVLLDCDAAKMGMAARCAELWRAALFCYLSDVKVAAKGYRHADREALNDLMGNRRLLKHLCLMADADPDVVAGAMLFSTKK